MTKSQNQASAMTDEFRLPYIGAILPNINTGKVELLPCQYKDSLKNYGQLAVNAYVKWLAATPAQQTEAQPISDLAAFQYWAACQQEPITPWGAWQAKAQQQSRENDAELLTALQMITTAQGDSTCDNGYSPEHIAKAAIAKEKAK